MEHNLGVWHRQLLGISVRIGIMLMRRTFSRAATKQFIPALRRIADEMEKSCA